MGALRRMLQQLSEGYLRFLTRSGSEAVAGLIAIGSAILVAAIATPEPSIKIALFVAGGALAGAGGFGAISLARASGSLRVVPECRGMSAVLSVENTGILSVGQLTAEGFIYFGAPRDDEMEYPIRWRGRASAEISLGSKGGHGLLDVAALEMVGMITFYTAQQQLAGRLGGETRDHFSRSEIEAEGFIVRATFTAVAGLSAPLVKYYQLRMNPAPDRGFHEVDSTMTEKEMRRAEDEKVPSILFEEITEDEAVRIRG